MEDYSDLNPEIAAASPLMQGLIDLGHDASTIGVDPATAIAIVAAVPVALRLLRMGNEFTSAIANDIAEKKRLERKDEELAIEHKWHERKEAATYRHREFRPGKAETKGEPFEGVSHDIGKQFYAEDYENNG